MKSTPERGNRCPFVDMLMGRQVSSFIWTVKGLGLTLPSYNIL